MRKGFRPGRETPARPPVAKARIAGVDFLTRHAEPAGPKSVLHVGCGAANPEKLHPAFQGPDWREVRFDIDPGVAPDIVGDMIDMQGVAGESFDAVWSSHNIEHLFAHQVQFALKEFVRVLKPGGFVLITCPDLQAICALVAEGRLHEPAYVAPSGPISPLDVIYGYGRAIEHGKIFMAHKTGFTRATLKESLTKAGLQRAECIIGGEFSLWASGAKPAN